MTNLTAEQLANNANFKSVTEIALDLLKGEIVKIGTLGKEEIAARAQRARAIQQKAHDLQKRKSSEVPDRLLAEISELMGIKPAAFYTLVGAMRDHVGALLKAHPEMETINGAEVVALVRESMERQGAQQKIMAVLANQNAEDILRCQNMCDVVTLFLLLLVGVSYILAAVACGFLVLIVPLFILCIIGAIADALAKTDVVMGWGSDCVNRCADV